MKTLVLAAAVVFSLAACGNHNSASTTQAASDAARAPVAASADSAASEVAQASAPHAINVLRADQKSIAALSSEMETRVGKVKGLSWNGPTLSAQIGVTLGDDGSLVSTTVAKSSGNYEYDQYALAVYKVVLAKPLVIDGKPISGYFTNTLNTSVSDASASDSDTASALGAASASKDASDKVADNSGPAPKGSLANKDGETRCQHVEDQADVVAYYAVHGYDRGMVLRTMTTTNSDVNIVNFVFDKMEDGKTTDGETKRDAYQACLDGSLHAE